MSDSSRNERKQDNDETERDALNQPRGDEGDNGDAVTSKAGGDQPDERAHGGANRDGASTDEAEKHGGAPQ